MLILHFFQEGLEFLHVLNFSLNFFGLLQEVLALISALSKFIPLLLDFFLFDLMKLSIFLPAHLMRLEECRELNKVILNQYVLLSKFSLPFLEVFLLLLELFLLVFKCLLDFVHSPTFFQ